MKKTRVISIITIFVALFLIITGYSMLFINDYVVDAKETESYASLIKNSYLSYTDELETLSYEIKEVNVLNFRYYMDIKNNYFENISELSTIEKHIKDVEQTFNILSYECNIRDYNDYDIDHKCESIKYNYEATINAYISIANKYNKRIEEFNNWTQENNKIEKYKSAYSKYVDLDKDGVFSGKLN